MTGNWAHKWNFNTAMHASCVLLFRWLSLCSYSFALLYFIHIVSVYSMCCSFIWSSSSSFLFGLVKWFVCGCLSLSCGPRVSSTLCTLQTSFNVWKVRLHTRDRPTTERQRLNTIAPIHLSINLYVCGKCETFVCFAVCSESDSVFRSHIGKALRDTVTIERNVRIYAARWLYAYMCSCVWCCEWVMCDVVVRANTI